MTGSARNVAETVQEIIAACRSMTGLPYDGEPVDQLEHALQCAWLARSSGTERDLVIAALLHDIARAPAVAGIAYDGPKEHHGEAAARWLAPRVGPRIAWLAEQHVPAKRYLVATEIAYHARLTEVSARTLIAQGGPMNDDEVTAFRSNPDWQLAVALRDLDDRGKVPGAVVPGLDEYRTDLIEVVGEALGPSDLTLDDVP
jgi:predicted HD phosphohydrolase